MPEDHLSTETAISAELTENGVKAAAKSRTVAAVDRLVGNVADLGNAWLEGITSRKRAQTDGEQQLIAAAAQYGILRMGQDQVFADRAFENHFRKVAEMQANKDAVVSAALSDLCLQPPSDLEANAGPAAVNDDFMARFETYAEVATSDELRAKWGRVLAAEVRRPGTFSAKVLRVVEELEPSTALLFEQLCRHRAENTIVKCLAGELPFADRINLVSSNLLVDPGPSGQIRRFAPVTDSAGEEYWMCSFSVASFAVGKRLAIPNARKGDLPPLIKIDGEPAVPVYVLTDVGYAVSSILRDHQEEAFAAYVERLASFIAPSEVREFRKAGDGQYRLARMVSKAGGGTDSN